jgi:hypothetical protein
MRKLFAIFILICFLLFAVFTVFQDEVYQRLVVTGGIYKKCYDYSNPFESVAPKCRTVKVLDKQDGYIQFEVLASDWWISSVGSIYVDDASYFYKYNERIK